MGSADAAPRLIATDLDGTLLRPDGSVSDRTRQVLGGVARAGIQIVLVTARPPRAVDHLADLVGSHGTVICANGAFVYDLTQRRVVQSHGLAPGLIAEIAGDLRRAIPGIAFGAELADGVVHEPDYPPMHPDDVPADVVHSAIDHLTRDAGKLLARPRTAAGPGFVDQVAALVGQRALVTHSGAGDMAEIGPPGVTKATAVRDWCTTRGIDAREVWAFGDMPNDLPLLRWAGRSFAVANAHLSVLAAADHLCGSNADDGVAEVLQRLLPAQELPE